MTAKFSGAAAALAVMSLWVVDARAQTFTALNYPGGGSFATFPSSINKQGQIAGYYATPIVGGSENFHGFWYRNGAWTTLNAPSAGNGAGQGTFAQGINDKGQIVGWYASSSNVWN